jgi:hypothetical protein
MSKVKIWSLRALAVAVCLWGFAYLRQHHLQIPIRDQVMLIAVSLACFVSLFWKRLYEHPGYACWLLCGSSTALFFRSWATHHFYDRGTLVRFVLFAVSVILVLVTWRRNEDKAKESRVPHP